MVIVNKKGKTKKIFTIEKDFFCSNGFFTARRKAAFWRMDKQRHLLTRELLYRYLSTSLMFITLYSLELASHVEDRKEALLFTWSLLIKLCSPRASVRPVPSCQREYEAILLLHR